MPSKREYPNGKQKEKYTWEGSLFATCARAIRTFIMQFFYPFFFKGAGRTFIALLLVLESRQRGHHAGYHWVHPPRWLGC